MSEVEVKLKNLEKGFEEMQNALRRGSQETNTTLSVLSKLSQDVLDLKAELNTLKRELEAKAKADLKASRTTY